jgi:hypothetical protein
MRIFNAVERGNPVGGHTGIDPNTASLRNDRSEHVRCEATGRTCA